MKFTYILSLLLRRPIFRGQNRIFSYLFNKNHLNQCWKIVAPIDGKFKINCDTGTWIGAKIAYTGEYEPELKKVFKSMIKKRDHVLDVGANIGFHTLYFADLVGENGKVTAFEPVPINYQILQENIKLNNFNHIHTKNIALSNKNEQLNISIDENSKNPGAFNLFEQDGNTTINCCIGDEEIGAEKVDFIKIDVEGYESFVIEGLLKTIKRDRPIIVFEFDTHYHVKTGLKENHIFLLLNSLNYSFKRVLNNGPVSILDFDHLQSGNVVAMPNA